MRLDANSRRCLQNLPLILRPVAILLRRLVSARSAGRTGRAQLVRTQLSVAVLIEFLQRFRRLGNFVGGDDAIMIKVERRNDRGWRTAPAFRTTGSVRAARGLLIAALRKANRAAGHECRDN